MRGNAPYVRKTLLNAKPISNIHHGSIALEAGVGGWEAAGSV